MTVPEKYKRLLVPRPERLITDRQTINSINHHFTHLNSETPIHPIKMVYCHLETDLSPESDVHYVNIRFYAQDYKKCDSMLLLMMRNAINLQTAVITQHYPMSSFEYGMSRSRSKANTTSRSRSTTKPLRWSRAGRWRTTPRATSSLTVTQSGGAKGSPFLFAQGHREYPRCLVSRGRGARQHHLWQ